MREPEGTAGPERDRGFRERKREDHALALIRELTARLDDLPRVKEILRELGRYYDPVLGGGVMALPHQKAIVRALEEGRMDDARAVIQSRYDLYMKDRIHLGGRRGDADG